MNPGPLGTECDSPSSTEERDTHTQGDGKPHSRVLSPLQFPPLVFVYIRSQRASPFSPLVFFCTRSASLFTLFLSFCIFLQLVYIFTSFFFSWSSYISLIILCIVVFFCVNSQLKCVCFCSFWSFYCCFCICLCSFFVYFSSLCSCFSFRSYCQLSV